MNDNVLPLVSQIVLDAFVAPIYAQLPRRSLGGFIQLPEHYMSRLDSNAYVDLLRSLIGVGLDLKAVCKIELIISISFDCMFNLPRRRRVCVSVV